MGQKKGFFRLSGKPYRYENIVDKDGLRANYEEICKFSDHGVWFPAPLQDICEAITIAKREIRRNDGSIDDYTIVDPGSGDGRAQIVSTGIFGLPSVGIEIDSYLHRIGCDIQKKLSELGVDLQKALFLEGNFLQHKYDDRKCIVFRHYSFGPEDDKLLKKLGRELPEGSYIFFYYIFPEQSALETLERIGKIGKGMLESFTEYAICRIK